MKVAARCQQSPCFAYESNTAIKLLQIPDYAPADAGTVQKFDLCPQQRIITPKNQNKLNRFSWTCHQLRVQLHYRLQTPVDAGPVQVLVLRHQRVERL